MDYDVAIVGSGPAGIFCALELIQHKPDLKVIIIERGKSIERRNCPNSDAAPGCKKCNPCDMLAGWGGAGSFSDGKLSISTQVGGWLYEFVGNKKLMDLEQYVDSKYLHYGAPSKIYGSQDDAVEEFSEKAALIGMELIPQNS